MFCLFSTSSSTCSTAAQQITNQCERERVSVEKNPGESRLIARKEKKRNWANETNMKVKRGKIKRGKKVLLRRRKASDILRISVWFFTLRGAVTKLKTLARKKNHFLLKFLFLFSSALKNKKWDVYVFWIKLCEFFSHVKKKGGNPKTIKSKVKRYKNIHIEKNKLFLKRKKCNHVIN